MMRIHILSPGFTNPNSAAFLFPLMRFRRGLRAVGFNIRVFHTICERLTDCDVLMIEHKAITKDWDEIASLEILEALSASVPIIWCDQSDSTGTFLGQVLPFVRKYLKAQILKDTQGYLNSYYGDRIYTDYYHKKHNISDNVEYKYTPAQDESDLSKIGTSWNSGLMNHGLYGPYLNRLREFVPRAPLYRFAKAMSHASASRPIDVSCRMGISYPRATARYQREQIRDILSDYVATDKLSRRQYFDELQSCKICVSPFGYGEITLKDFEVFLTGGILLKPDMSHMATWPHFYEADVTYVAHDWDLNDIRDRIESLLENDEKRTHVAQTAQDRYKFYTYGPDAQEEFIKHFASMV